MLRAAARVPHGGWNGWGYERPKQERIEVNIAYTTRRFRRVPHHMNGALLASISATPEGRRGGIIVAQEGNTWTVTMNRASPCRLDCAESCEVL